MRIRLKKIYAYTKYVFSEYLRPSFKKKKIILKKKDFEPSPNFKCHRVGPSSYFTNV